MATIKFEVWISLDEPDSEVLDSMREYMAQFVRTTNDHTAYEMEIREVRLAGQEG